MNDFLKRAFSLPGLKWAHHKINSLSATGKTVFGFFALIFIISGLALAFKVNAAFLVSVPRDGGTLTEGVIGVPRFINPLLAVTDSDKDLAMLVYSGLMRQMPDGSLIPDLAQSYTISPDGKTYDFILKNNSMFQDGTPVTADDIVYTINLAQDPDIKSPEQDVWTGVTAAKVNDHEVTFTLTQPYAQFLENTTLGILPKHLLENTATSSLADANININPIGSGPYKVSSIQHSSNGTPVSYTLTAFENFILGKPHIKTVITRFYNSQDDLRAAYEAHEIADMNSISSDQALLLKQHNNDVNTASLPRVFALFFNQNNNPALADVNVRQALAMSVDRGYIVNTVLHGFGTPLVTAVPNIFATGSSTLDSYYLTTHVDEANALLDKNGWKLDDQGIREKKTSNSTTTLAFSISTSDAPELKATANILKDEWQAIGATVTVKVVEGGYLDQNIIRPRKYDSLLFGEVVNPQLDLYAFWHSREVADPGLNVALYSNPNADKLIESMRVTLDSNQRQTEYQSFDAQLQKDMPAIFLYSPSFIYVMSPDIHNAALSTVSVPSDRLASVYTWYTESEHVWKIFK